MCVPSYNMAPCSRHQPVINTDVHIVVYKTLTTNNIGVAPVSYTFIKLCQLCTLHARSVSVAFNRTRGPTIANFRKSSS